jgi:ABC-type transport system substrate-binding protein
VQDPNGLTDKYTFAETNDMKKAQANSALAEFATWYNRAEMKLEPSLNIGSGPYVFDEVHRSENVIIKRNERYWNAGKNADAPAYLSKIIYRVMTDRSAAVTALKNQELDFMESLPPAKFAEEVDTTRTPFLVKHPFEAQYVRPCPTNASVVHSPAW